MLYPKITDMFYFAGDKHSTPNCPVELRPDLNPSSGIQSYDGSDSMCTKPAHYNIPFFLERLGPRFSEWSVNAHEARPGHHIQVAISKFTFVVVVFFSRYAFVSSFVGNQINLHGEITRELKRHRKGKGKS